MVGVALNENLSRISEIGIYAAMALYAAAFVSLALNLSRAASQKKKERATAARLEKVGIWLMVAAAASVLMLVPSTSICTKATICPTRKFS